MLANSNGNLSAIAFKNKKERQLSKSDNFRERIIKKEAKYWYQKRLSTVGENIIGASNMQIIFYDDFSNILIAILDFSLLLPI